MSIKLFDVIQYNKKAFTCTENLQDIFFEIFILKVTVLLTTLIPIHDSEFSCIKKMDKRTTMYQFESRD